MEHVKIYNEASSCYYSLMNHAAVIEQLKQTQEMLAKCSLCWSRRPRQVRRSFYQSRRQYRRTCERPNKGNKAFEREVIASFQVAQSLGLRATFVLGALAADRSLRFLHSTNTSLGNQTNGQPTSAG